MAYAQESFSTRLVNGYREAYEGFRLHYPAMEAVASIALGFVPGVGLGVASLLQARDAVVDMRRARVDMGGSKWSPIRKSIAFVKGDTSGWESKPVGKGRVFWLTAGLIAPVALSFVNPIAGVAAYGAVRGIRAIEEHHRAKNDGRIDSPLRRSI